MLLRRVRVRAVDHYAHRQPSFLELLGRVGHVRGRVVGAVAAAPMNDMTIRVALSADNARHALVRHTHEVVGAGCGANGVNRNLHRS